MIVEASFWDLSPSERQEQIPGLDPHCLICGQSLEGQPFVWELFMYPGLDVVGMHLNHAYSLSQGILRDLAATWHLDPAALKHFLEIYEQDRQTRAPRQADVPTP